MNKIEQLEQQLAAMQQELEDLKKAKGDDRPKAMLPKEGQYRLVGGAFFVDAEEYQSIASHGIVQNVFPDKETAEAYADAFRVILELRRQPGSGQLDEDGDGWAVNCYGERDYTDNATFFGVCPPFPCWMLARDAGEAVGIERIKKAYATLSGISSE